MDGVRKFEVAIIGGGPAGSAAALTLARAGRLVGLIEKQGVETFKVGEGLPPSARPLLNELGVLEQFNADGHLPSYGNDSAWGSPILQSTDFIRNRYGHGWHIDRPKFDAMLRAAAQKAGARIYEHARVTQMMRDTGRGWRVRLAESTGRREVRARWLIDCTGRLSWIARNQGVKRISDDRLLGFVALFSPAKAAAEADCDSLSLIEAARNGWWYTALLPTQQRIVVYFTDAGTPSSKLAHCVDGYLKLLNQTEHIGARLSTHRYLIEGQPRAVSANSARLERFVGDEWLAAGDAAVSFDPLSSQGLLTALYAGLKSGRALHAYLSGQLDALELYSRDIEAIYSAYLNNRTMFYAHERRWTKDEFWRRRQQQN
jgi:2-polyprenyl-6-methoxyphenol hydroxylase-like FAD-dependent oxidoreductase